MFTVVFIQLKVVYAQEKPQTIQLLIEETSSPLSYAYFMYGKEKGTANEQGIISLIYQQGARLTISHVEIGRKTYSDPSVKQFLELGTVRISAEIIHLQPVIIVAIHPQEQGLTLNDQDKLSHDAGATLDQLTEISTIKKGGNYGFDPVLRGFKYDQLNLVIDGVQTASAACPNRMDPPASQIPLNQIEKVEILKGPYVLRYGPSFGGVINFISSSSTFSQKPETSGRFTTGHYHNGETVKLEGRIKTSRPNYAMSIYGSWAQGQDYKDGSGNQVPAGFKKSSLGMNGALKLNNNNRAEISVSRNFARDVTFAGLPMDLQSDDTWLLKLAHIADYQGNVKNWSTSAYATFVDHYMDNLDKKIEPRMVNAKTPATTTTYGGKSEITLDLKHGWTYLGIDSRTEEASGTRSREFLMGPNAGKTVFDNAWQKSRITRNGLFFEYHYHPNQYHLIASGRLDKVDASPQNAATEYLTIYGNGKSTQVNPSFSVGVNRDLGQSFNMGLWLGRGQRSGNISEKFINFFPIGLDPYELVGNPYLKPEINHQADLNFNIKKDDFKISLNFFGSWLKDFITSEINSQLNPRLPSSPGVRQFINLDRARLMGFECTWMQKWLPNIGHQLDMAYTYGKNITTDQPLPEIPPMDIKFKIYGSIAGNRITPELSIRHALRQKRISSSFGESATEAFTLANFHTSVTVSKNMKISGGVDNIFNKTYHEHLNRMISNREMPINAPGRNFYINLNILFLPKQSQEQGAYR